MRRIPGYGILFCTAAVCLSPGCSNEQVYNMIRENRLQECNTLPIKQQEACRTANSQTYDDYESKKKASGL